MYKKLKQCEERPTADNTPRTVVGRYPDTRAQWCRSSALGEKCDMTREQGDRCASCPVRQVLLTEQPDRHEAGAVTSVRSAAGM